MKFGFFQIAIKFGFRHAIKLGQPTLGKTPERFNTVNMAAAPSKFITAMIYSVMFVIATPAIAVNDTFRFDFPTRHPLRRPFSGIRNNLGIDFPLTLKNTKHDGFARSITASFAGNPPGTEVGFIHFNRPLEGACCSDQRAILVRNLSKIVVIDRTEMPVSSAVSVAVKSNEKHLNRCQN